MAKPSLRRFRLTSLASRKHPRRLPAADASRPAIFEPLEPRLLLSAVTLDPAFGGDGIVQTDLTGILNGTAVEVLRQDDGKLIVVGDSHRQNGSFFTAVRYNPDGTLDTSFGDGGQVLAVSNARPHYSGGALIDDQGRIVIGGVLDRNFERDIALLRLNSDGSIDTTFGDGGWSVHDLNSRSTYWGDMELHEGDLLITASHGSFGASILTMRVNDTGSLDAGFGNGGWITTTPAFNSYGKVILPDAEGFTVVADSEAAEPNTRNPLVVRYHHDGTLDTSFGINGMAAYYISNHTPVYDAVRAPDGGLLITGSARVENFTDLLVLKTTPEGQRDTTFGTTGWRTYNLDPNNTIDQGNDITLDGDHILVAGSYSRLDGLHGFAIRLALDGEFDPAYGTAGRANPIPGSFASALLDPDGNFVAAGVSDNQLLLARYAPDGHLDATLDGDGASTAQIAYSQNQHLVATAVQADGKIIGVGQHTVGTFDDAWVIARYNEDGTPDTTFGNGLGWVALNHHSGSGEIAKAVAIDAQQRIVVTGSSGGFNIYTARLNPDGSLDTSFDGDGLVVTNTGPSGGNAHGESIAIDTSGRIIVAGGINGRMGAFRYLDNGALDPAFGLNGMGYNAFANSPTDAANDMVIDSAGRILLTGRFVVGRFTENGLVDTSFGGGDGAAVADVLPDRDSTAIAIDANGRIVLGGYGETISSAGRHFALARFDDSGAIDATFGVGGIAVSDIPEGSSSDIVIDAHGRIIAVGRTHTPSSDLRVARYLPDGRLDTSFDGEDGVIDLDLGTGEAPGRALLDAEGRLLMVSRVSTPHTGSDLALVRWNIAPPPPDNPTADFLFLETDEDIALAGQVTGSDPQGQALTFALVEAPEHGSLQLLPDGSFVYTPSLNYNGFDRFTFIASDDTFDSVPASVNIQVHAVNDAPVAVDDQYSTGHDTQLEIDLPGVRGNDFDPEGTILTVTRLTAPANGVVSLGPGGSLTYWPDAGFVGTDSFTYHVSDGLLTSNVATVTIHVTNAIPVAAGMWLQTREDDSVQAFASATDADGDDVTFHLVDKPQHGTFNGFFPDGFFIYIPGSNYHGTDSFTYRVHDGVSYSEPATVSVNVSSVNDWPFATGEQYTVQHDRPLNVAAPGLLLNDADIEGSPLALELLTTTANGTLNLNDDGSFNYLPNQHFVGTDSFTYRVNDGQLDSSSATVTIRVTNQAPVLWGKHYFVSEDSVVEGSIAATDADGDALTYELVSGVALGELDFRADGTFTYTPPANFVGQDIFTVRATDGVAYSFERSVALQFYAINDAPVAAGDAYALRQDAPLVITDPTAGLLANDSDVDGDALTAVLKTQAANGTVTLNADGTFSYVPDSGFVGTDSFTYAAGDGGRSAIATVTLTVAPFDAPSNLVASVSGSDVTLSWLDHGSGYTEGYIIERATKPKAGRMPSFQPVGTASGTTFIDHGVGSGTWLYRVKAFDGAYSSDYSSAVQVSIGGGGGGGKGKKNRVASADRTSGDLLLAGMTEDGWSTQSSTTTADGGTLQSDSTIDLLSLVQSGVTLEVKGKKK